jgi:hypothetical protein
MLSSKSFQRSLEIPHGPFKGTETRLLKKNCKMVVTAEFTDKGSSNGKKEQSSVLVEVKNKDQYISYRNRHF